VSFVNIGLAWSRLPATDYQIKREENVWRPIEERFSLPAVLTREAAVASKVDRSVLAVLALWACGLPEDTTTTIITLAFWLL
jgi:hypothetical protein